MVNMLYIVCNENSYFSKMTLPFEDGSFFYLIIVIALVIFLTIINIFRTMIEFVLFRVIFVLTIEFLFFRVIYIFSTPSHYIPVTISFGRNDSTGIPWATIVSAPLQNIQMAIRCCKSTSLFIPWTTIFSTPL